MNETDKLIENQLKRLPENLQKAINAVPWKVSINGIALLNNLKVEQVEIIERETMFIIYGFENPEDYIVNMVREAQIDESIATKIAETANERIFKVISQKIDALEKQQPSVSVTSTPEIHPENLPMVEKGEVVHEVPHVEHSAVPPTTPPVSTIPTTPPPPKAKPEPQAPLPDYRYPGGKDPYREPLV